MWFDTINVHKLVGEDRCKHVCKWKVNIMMGLQDLDDGGGACVV
jgi:hypothetical protein